MDCVVENNAHKNIDEQFIKIIILQSPVLETLGSRVSWSFRWLFMVLPTRMEVIPILLAIDLK
jgi:hypothetical protein